MKYKLTNNILLVVLVVFVVLCIGIRYSGITGAAVINCKFTWPQEVIIDGVPYGCSDDKAYCNNEKAKIGIPECCAKYAPYKDCKAVTPADKLVVSKDLGCKETDSGKDFFKKGTTYMDGSGMDDFCRIEGNDAIQKETAIGKGELIELYCEKNQRRWESRKVGTMEICRDGAIVKVQGPLEPPCRDTDGGKDFFKKGTIYRNGKLDQSDFCSAKRGNNNLILDYTNPGEGELIELYCDGYPKWESRKVGQDEKCEDGKIIKIPELPCKDTDKGRDYSVRGDIYLNGKWADADYCTDANNKIVSKTEVGKGALNEFYCENNEKLKIVVPLKSTEICENGIIKGGQTPPPQQPQPPPQSNCKDSDVTSQYPDGKNYYLRGTIKIRNVVNDSDYCMENGKKVDKTGIGGWLKEFYCENGGQKYMVVKEPSKRCEEGKIV